MSAPPTDVLPADDALRAASHRTCATRSASADRGRSRYATPIFFASVAAGHSPRVTPMLGARRGRAVTQRSYAGSDRQAPVTRPEIVGAVEFMTTDASLPR